ncbi:hypothetical protein LZ634_16540 [Kluyvera intermedia]|uniref:hypothetical protein n=1 Tax=Kluyvera intermedia TaxID=61648 RepID=UPI001F18014A|nr:hypothetical protein [Kluyvera intermedia]MCE9890310.1 hypothetical protein [Kluyvera intermedia]
MNISLSGQAVVLFAFLPLLAWAGNHHVVTVPGGDVHFSGAVVEAACVVDTDSEAQTSLQHVYQRRFLGRSAAFHYRAERL